MMGGGRNVAISDASYATPLDITVSRLAARQHGIVSLAQLEAVGLGRSGVRDRVAAGRLHRIHRGVYSVGHSLLSAEGRWMAAVLSYGERAVLSHRSAAQLWDLRRGGGATIDVTVPRGYGRSRGNIKAHEVRSLTVTDITRVRGIPCTTVPRTLLDLAEVLDRQRLARAIAQAEVMGVFDLNALNDMLERAPGRRGSATLRTILDEYDEGTALTQSELEELVLATCLTVGVERPRVNQSIVLDDGAVQVDLLWPKQKLIVEVDGHRFHGNRRAFEHDRDRDQRLVLAGYRVVRFTWRQITREPDEVGRRIAELLSPTPGVARPVTGRDPPSLPKET
jgi:predicted transcriptional regulator of viral defense system